MNLYEMKLGDNVWCSEMQSNVLRVPGGWLFRPADGERDVFTASTFVPFNNEFMTTSEQGESPATTGNSDYAAALRVWKEFNHNEIPICDVDFVSWCEHRLNAQKDAHCA
jgi:hypothetical protein